MRYSLGVVGIIGFYHVIDYIESLKTQLECLSYEVVFFPLFKLANDENDQVLNYTQLLIEWIALHRPCMLIWSYNCFSWECFQRNLKFPFLLHVYYNPEDHKATQKELQTILLPMDYVLTKSEAVELVAGQQKTLLYVNDGAASGSDHDVFVLVRSREDQVYNKVFSSIKNFTPIVLDTDDAREVLQTLRGIRNLKGIIYTGESKSDVGNESLLVTYMRQNFPGAWFSCVNIEVSEYSTGCAKTLNEVHTMLETLEPVKNGCVVEILDQILLNHLCDKTFLKEQGLLPVVNAAIENKKLLRPLFCSILLTPCAIEGPIDVAEYVSINRLDANLFAGNEHRAKAHWLFVGEKAGLVMCVRHDNETDTQDGLTSLTSLNISLLKDLLHLRTCPDQQVIEKIRLACSGNDGLLFSHMNIVNTTYLQHETCIPNPTLFPRSVSKSKPGITKGKAGLDSSASIDAQKRQQQRQQQRMKHIRYNVLKAKKIKNIARNNQIILKRMLALQLR